MEPTTWVLTWPVSRSLIANHGRLADGPAPGPELLAGMFVPLFPADIGLIHFHRASELRRFGGPGFPDAVGHVPSGLLGNPQVPVQFHAGDALEVGGVEEERDGPLGEGEVGALHNRPGLDREILAAVLAVEGHGLAVGPLADVDAAAVGAGHPVRPALLDKPGFGLGLVAEGFNGLDEGDSLAV